LRNACSGRARRFPGKRDRRDCVDDLPRFWEVVANPDSPDAVAFTMNDFPARRNFSSGRLLDRQSPKADEKIVGPVMFVPCRKEDREVVVPGLSSLSSAAYPRGHRQVARVRDSLTIHKRSSRAQGGAISQLQAIEWHDVIDSVRGLWLTLALYPAEMHPRVSAKKLLGDFSRCTVRYAFVEHFW
jgi:hypothetical protein